MPSMAEFIGSRISLISKRDIRYVGTLHEISSENSTVALEQVVSYGTEGRRPDDEVPASDNVYEYIVFRGGDVKDLRIEDQPKENSPPAPPPIPNDPAILGSARRPNSTVTNPNAQPPKFQQQPQQRQPPPPYFPQHPSFPYQFPPPNQRFGPQGFPPGPAFPGMPYGAPPGGWYPPPGYGFPHMPPGQFHPHPNQIPIGPPGQSQQRQPPPQTTTSANGPSGPGSDPKAGDKPVSKPSSPPGPIATVKLPTGPSPSAAPVTTADGGPPPPPIESKPDVAAALAPPAPAPALAPVPAQTQSDLSATKAIPVGPKSGRIVPVVPLPSPNIKVPVPVTANGAGSTVSNGVPAAASQRPTQPAATKSTAKSKTIEEANRGARAAVAAAMAKLPPAPDYQRQADSNGALDNLTKKVNEMRTNDKIRTSRHPGTGGYAAGHRGGERGGHRGGRRNADHPGKKVAVPTTDYDFATANAKFNKQDLVKEAIASGSPVVAAGEAPVVNGTTASSTTNGDGKSSETTVPIPAAVGYNKNSSFFDNISSEIKDRTDDGGRLGGREFRHEERQKNLETFGQGSVDNGYRGGYGRGPRGRGRGYSRGRGGRGGYDGRGRNGVRGGGSSAGGRGGGAVVAPG